MRFTAVVVSTFLLVGNVIAASSYYGGDWLEARNYNYDLEPRGPREVPKPLQFDKCDEKFRSSKPMSGIECREKYGTGWKGNDDKTCYSVEEAAKKFPNKLGGCFLDPFDIIDERYDEWVAAKSRFEAVRRH
ncbi:hypothetical protein AX17_006458 [Amanita inopinata Kibby_2008]|nr:hypothetical protein AX17_006458 [Amanita inopinata Kibby_2008]